MTDNSSYKNISATICGSDTSPSDYIQETTNMVSECDTIKILQDENLKLKQELFKLKDYESLKDTCVNQSIHINSLEKQIEIGKNKLIEAKRIIKEHESKIFDNNTYTLMYDITNFPNVNTVAGINLVWDKFFQIAKSRISGNEYVMESSSDLVPFYIVITECDKLQNSSYHYTGSLSSFCDCWNENIKHNLSDPERIKELTCHYDSIKAEINKSPWKNTDITSWRKRSMEDKKNRRKLKRAVNIMLRIVG